MPDLWIDPRDILQGGGEAPGAGLIKILSIDGGGLYGLMSALLLQDLDASLGSDKGLFLPEVDLFTGISAGAVISLLLAKHRNPIDGLVEAVDFFKEPIGMFSNMNPLAAALSLFGVGGWVGSCDFQYQLARHFGDMTLGQLEHLVLISTFSWTGAKHLDFGPAQDKYPPYFWESTLPSFTPATASSDRSWRPKFFTNYHHEGVSDPDIHYRVADVAYGAASPAGLRAIRGGIADAGTFAGNPAVEAISYTVQALRQASPELRKGGAWLDDIACLSVGNGGAYSSYWLRNQNYGPLRFSLSRTNPPQGNYFATATSSSFAGSFEDVNYMAHALLDKRYYRLDPQVLTLPLAIPTLLARFPSLRSYFTQQIEAANRDPKTIDVVKGARHFIKRGWRAPFEGEMMPD